jgi:hypothetical protein
MKRAGMILTAGLVFVGTAMAQMPKPGPELKKARHVRRQLDAGRKYEAGSHGPGRIDEGDGKM